MLSFYIRSVFRLFAKGKTFVYMPPCSRKFDNSRTSSIYFSGIDKYTIYYTWQKAKVCGNRLTLIKQSSYDVQESPPLPNIFDLVKTNDQFCVKMIIKLHTIFIKLGRLCDVLSFNITSFKTYLEMELRLFTCPCLFRKSDNSGLLLGQISSKLTISSV